MFLCSDSHRFSLMATNSNVPPPAPVQPLSTPPEPGEVQPTPTPM